MRLEGKVALMTCGAQGQGESEARLFAAEGARVVVADIQDDAAEAVCRDNAGIFHSAPLAETTVEDYMAVVNVDQLGVFLGMRAAAPQIAEGGGGSIINISSVLGLVGSPNSYGYVSSKFAVRGMTKAAAAEFGPVAVRLNSVHPGLIETEMARAAATDLNPDVLQPLVAGIPLQRRAPQRRWRGWGCSWCRMKAHTAQGGVRRRRRLVVCAAIAAGRRELTGSAHRILPENGGVEGLPGTELLPTHETRIEDGSVFAKL